METLARETQQIRSAAAAEQLSELIAHSQLLQEQTLAVRATLDWNAEAAIRAELDRANLQLEGTMLALERAIELTRSAQLPAPAPVTIDIRPVSPAAARSAHLPSDRLVMSLPYVSGELDPIGIIMTGR
jgi:hypothetical protein